MIITRKLFSLNGSVVVTLPKDALQALNAQAGDSVVIIVDNGKVEIKKVEL